MSPIISSYVANGILLESPESDKVPAILCCSSHGLLYSDSAETRSMSVIAFYEKVIKVKADVAAYLR